MDESRGVSLPYNSIFLFHFSQSQPIDFEYVFPRADTSSKNILNTISKTRLTLFQTLSLDDNDASLNATNIYLPYLFGLIEEAKQLPDDVPIPRLKISWTSSLGYKYSKKYYTSNHWHFEVINIILIYGLLYRSKALSLLKSMNTIDNINNYSVNTVKYLRIASGIFNYIKDIELSRWTNKPQELLPEKYTEYYTILSVLCIAEAEQIAIRKAFYGGMGFPALIKICMDVSGKFKYISTILESPGFCDTFNMPHINTYCAFNNHLYELFAYKLMGMETKNKGEYGKAISYLSLGIQKAQNFDLCKKDKTADAVRLRTHYSEQLIQLQQLHSNLSKENSSIYYERIPPISELDKLTTREIITPIEWSPPKPIVISLTMEESSSCNIM